MPEKVLLSVRLVETDAGYTVEVEAPGREPRRRRTWRRGCWAGPRPPAQDELRAALESLQSLYNELYGEA